MQIQWQAPEDMPLKTVTEIKERIKEFHMQWDVEETTQQETKSTVWAVMGENIYYPCEKSSEKLDSGMYRIYQDSAGKVYFSKMATETDNLMILPDTASDEVMQSVNDFWERREKFTEFGFMWKRGYLLYGPPGSGKTSTIQLIMRKVIGSGGIAIYANHPSIDARGLAEFRKIEPNTPLVVVLEDIDSIIDDYGESELLALLDGETQIDKIIFIATTNYPEKLDKRFANRPSRFDFVKEIGMPSPSARRMFLSAKNPRLNQSPEELELWVTKSKNYSIAHLKELIVSVECLGNSFEETTKRLSDMINIDIKSDTSKVGGFGFGAG